MGKAGAKALENGPNGVIFTVVFIYLAKSYLSLDQDITINGQIVEFLHLRKSQLTGGLLS